MIGEPWMSLLASGQWANGLVYEFMCNCGLFVPCFMCFVCCLYCDVVNTLNWNLKWCAIVHCLLYSHCISVYVFAYVYNIQWGVWFIMSPLTRCFFFFLKKFSHNWDLLNISAHPKIKSRLCPLQSWWIAMTPRRAKRSSATIITSFNIW